MSVRRTVSIGVVVAILVTVAIEAATDVVVDRITTQREVAMAERATRAADAAVARTSANGPGTLQGRTFSADGRASWTRPSGSSLEPWPPDATPRDWDVRTIVVVPDHGGAGIGVEVAVERTSLEALTSDPLVLDLLDLPLFVVVALLAARWIASRTDRSLEPVADAVEGVVTRYASTAPSVVGGDPVVRLERATDLLRETVERSIERERTFTRYASHELRTPLSAIKLQVDRLRSATTSPERVAGVLDRNVHRMETVMAALQSLAHAAERDQSSTALAHVIAEIVASRPAHERDRLAVTSVAENATVTDAGILRQAVLNLVDNALIHSQGRVSIAAHVQGTALTVRVRDQGPGVPDDEIARLVEPFYRPSTSTASGLGLGLSLVDVIARALDGELEVRNTGSGLEATLRLPIAARVDTATATTPTPYAS